MVKDAQFGIYLNTEENTVMRISSVYWIPSGKEWVLLTPDVNATLLRTRQLAAEAGLVPDPGSITWGSWDKVPKPGHNAGTSPG